NRLRWPRRGVAGDHSLFIGPRRAAVPLPTAPGNFFTLHSSRQADHLRTGNDNYDLAFRRLTLVMRKEFTCGAAPKFLEFFCQLSCNTKLPIRHNIDAGGKRFGQTIKQLKKDNCLAGISGSPQLAFALSTFDRKKSAKAKFFGGKAGPDECCEN